ncbi:MAG TPA: penicillin acylase family protein [Povalibacter sp.]|uniref:penicillin acylase family protein n=1 Tax=Povalibacter sp. TaxID=1962978 RepID=UPI002CC7D707|nr:penicillin acylase family protein [Povalibacter sp.]HMN45328.1 penicillin acylase family protein [Povalibacter sp.]
MKGRVPVRLFRRILIAIVALVAITAGALYVLFRGSLPQLDGDIAGTGATATIERDANGTPTITGTSRRDLAYATGYAHSQDRFFQMDLMRRAAAGELAELLGAAALDTDRHFRIHGFRAVAQQVVAQMPDEDRRTLDAYVAGVNRALGDARARPWEYLLLREQPRAWLPEDSVLAAFSMYLSLNDSTGAHELARSQLREALPPALFDFLHPLGTEWDAPVTGGTWRVAAIPGPEIVDLRSGEQHVAALLDPPSRTALEERPVVGSNSWAVAAPHAAGHAALLANDMHLGLRLPHVWYRARLKVSGGAEAPRDLVGVTLPGLPIIVVGSNGQVAWGFTNSYGDWTDLVIVETDPANPDRYFVGDDTEAFVKRTESIAVRGGSPVSLDVTATRWGPIINHDAQGRPLALAWTAHDPRATNVRMLDFETAATVQEALLAANRSGAPVQNFLAVDRAGHIGWSLMGQVPIRANYDSTQPASWRAPGTGWIGWHAPEDYPRIIDPAPGRLWTANARTIDVDTWLNFMGDGGYDLGARAAQIRDDLLALRAATATDLAKIQIDDRALFMTRWRDLLLQLLDDAAVADHPARRLARERVERWSGRASADDLGYPVVRAFRQQVRKQVFDSLTSQARLEYPEAKFEPSAQFEGALWQLVTQQPAHLLDPHYATWEAALLAALDTSTATLARECADPCSWGRQNTLQMHHPLSAALPFSARWLDMPADRMHGDFAMPLAQGPAFGASQRLVVSPGREAEGLFQMPGGPVDHPLSPFYGAGHEAWVRGEPQPLLPGKTEHTLRLAQ